jgi:hypothetical protein
MMEHVRARLLVFLYFFTGLLLLGASTGNSIMIGGIAAVIAILGIGWATVSNAAVVVLFLGLGNWLFGLPQSITAVFGQ